MLHVSESRAYKRQGRRKNSYGWRKHLRDMKRSAHKRCRQITQIILRRNDGE